MLVHLCLFFQVLGFLLIDELLDALKLCKVLLLVLLNQHLEPFLHGLDLASQLLLRLNASLFLRLKLLPLIVFLCEQILDYFTLLRNLSIDLAKIIQQ